MLDDILPVSNRAEGLRADTAAGKHLAPTSLASAPSESNLQIQRAKRL
jgi:hypothetical protein